MLPLVLDFAHLRTLYESGVGPREVIEEVIARCDAYEDKAVWIARVSPVALREEARRLELAPGPRPPLWGIPFAIKDNIDCVGLPTTAGCPSFAYRPEQDAPVVARLKQAGALLVGKTNLDQFATGLNGTRSPYGAPHSVFGAAYISGGSSSGSAVAVAAGLVAFALGTDTAGSGRVPAAFNNIVGVKPTRGLLSTRGVVPACRSLDCVSLFGTSLADADALRRIAQGFDAADPFSRADAPRSLPSSGWRFGVLAAAEREFFGDNEAARLYEASILRMEALGGISVPIDYALFREAAALLYEGPFVAERLAALGPFLAEAHDDVDPAVRSIVESAKRFDAADCFRAVYRLAELSRAAAGQWREADFLLLPTAPTICSIAEMRADPVRLNARLGLYTNFVNLLDCCAVAIPAGFRRDGLPFGVSLIAPAFHDSALAHVAGLLQAAQPFGSGIDREAPLPKGIGVADIPDLLPLMVVGAHLSGMPLNDELRAQGGVLLRSCRTAADYRLFVLPGAKPAKPGLLRAPGFRGPGIEGEIWGLPPDSFARFVAAIPAPLGIGRITLEDGSSVSGFLAEAHALAGAQEITALGGWRRFCAVAA